MTQKIDTKARVYEITNSFSTAMFVTVDASGYPRSRPMHIAQVEENGGDIWFFTGKGGTLAREVQQQAMALLVFENDSSAYLSLRGEARLVHDPAKIQQLWKEPYKVWFPGGPGDPELTLVAVKPAAAEYWDNRGTNKLEYLFEAAKAYIKGEKPQVDDADQHAKTSL